MKKIIFFGFIIVVLLGAVATSLLLKESGSESNPENPVEMARDVGLERFFVKDAQERNALCNDGSDPVYYYRPAEEGFEGDWVFWFEGGGSCRSEEECQNRWKEERYLMTTKTSAPRASKPDGILSVDPDKNPDFYQWNHVILNYCSSDGWIGDTVAEIGRQSVYFNGKNIAQAIFEDLSDESVFGSSAITLADQVLITGTSAGGTGVSQNLNDIANYLQDVDVRGVIDSSWGLRTDDSIYSEEELKVLSVQAMEFQNSQYDSVCLADNPEDSRSCNSAAKVSAYWEVPVFIYLDQMDRKTLEVRYGVFDLQDPDMQTIIEKHAALIMSAVQELDAVFSPRSSYHGALNLERFTSLKIDGYSFQEVLGNWYFDREGPISAIATE